MGDRVKRALLIGCLCLAPVGAWGAYNEPTAVTAITGMGQGVLAVLQTAMGSIGGIASIGGTSITPGDCVEFGSGGTVQDAGGTCTTGGGGGTVGAGTAGQLAQYASSGTTVSGFTLGTSVSALLRAAADATGGLVSFSNLVADIQAQSNPFLVTGGALGTPSSGVMTNLTGTPSSIGLANGTGLPVSTGISGFGTSVVTALQTAVNSASGFIQLNSSGFIPSTVQVGAAGGTTAGAGNIGEVIAVDVPVGSAVAVATAVAKTITSVSITPGDWNCTGSIATAPGGTTTTSNVGSGLSLTANTLPANEFQNRFFGGLPAGAPYADLVPGTVENVSSTTTLFLVGQSGFSVSTMGMYGQISCRRMR